MDARRALLLHVVDGFVVVDPMQTSHDRGLNQAHRSVHVVVLQFGNEYFVGLLDEVLLDCSDALNVLDVLVELWINRHVLCAHCKPFAMLIRASNIKHERNYISVLAHHFLEKCDGQVHALNDQ